MGHHVYRPILKKCIRRLNFRYSGPKRLQKSLSYMNIDGKANCFNSTDLYRQLSSGLLLVKNDLTSSSKMVGPFPTHNLLVRRELFSFKIVERKKRVSRILTISFQ